MFDVGPVLFGVAKFVVEVVDEFLEEGFFLFWFWIYVKGLIDYFLIFLMGFLSVREGLFEFLFGGHSLDLIEVVGFFYFVVDVVEEFFEVGFFERFDGWFLVLDFLFFFLVVLLLVVLGFSLVDAVLSDFVVEFLFGELELFVVDVFVGEVEEFVVGEGEDASEDEVEEEDGAAGVFEVEFVGVVEEGEEDAVEADWETEGFRDGVFPVASEGEDGCDSVEEY